MTRTDGRCSECHGPVVLHRHDIGFHDPDTGYSEPACDIFRCTKCGARMPEDELDHSPVAGADMIPAEPVEAWTEEEDAA